MFDACQGERHCWYVSMVHTAAVYQVLNSWIFHVDYFFFIIEDLQIPLKGLNVEN